MRKQSYYLLGGLALLVAAALIAFMIGEDWATFGLDGPGSTPSVAAADESACTPDGNLPAELKEGQGHRDPLEASLGGVLTEGTPPSKEGVVDGYTCHVSGRVIGPSNEVIAGAEIQLMFGSELGSVCAVTTDDGTYQGTYSLKTVSSKTGMIPTALCASRPGYITRVSEIHKYQVGADEEAHEYVIDFVLPIGADVHFHLEHEYLEPIQGATISLTRASDWSESVVVARPPPLVCSSDSEGNAHLGGLQLKRDYNVSISLPGVGLWCERTVRVVESGATVEMVLSRPCLLEISVIGREIESLRKRGKVVFLRLNSVSSLSHARADAEYIREAGGICSIKSLRRGDVLDVQIYCGGRRWNPSSRLRVVRESSSLVLDTDAMESEWIPRVTNPGRISPLIVEWELVGLDGSPLRNHHLDARVMSQCFADWSSAVAQGRFALLPADRSRSATIRGVAEVPSAVPVTIDWDVFGTKRKSVVHESGVVVRLVTDISSREPATGGIQFMLPIESSVDLLVVDAVDRVSGERFRKNLARGVAEEYEFMPIPSGQYDVRVKTRGQSRWFGTLDIVDDLQTKVDLEFVVDGSVVGALPPEVGVYRIVLCPIGRDGLRVLMPTHECGVGAGGRFLLTHVQEGRYQVYAGAIVGTRAHLGWVSDVTIEFKADRQVVDLGELSINSLEAPKRSSTWVGVESTVSVCIVSKGECAFRGLLHPEELLELRDAMDIKALDFGREPFGPSWSPLDVEPVIDSRRGGQILMVKK